MPLEGVLRRFRVVGIPVRRVAVHQEAVVALAKLRVTVVVRDVPFQPVPRAQHHVLRTLVNREEVVRKEVVGQQVVTVEIAVDLRLELVAGEGRGGFRVRPGGDARPDPAVKAFQGGLLRRGKPAPSDIPVALRLAGRVDAVVDFSAGVEVGFQLAVTGGGKQADRRGVVQHLQGDRALRGEALHTLHAEHRTALALLVVEVVLTVVGVLTVRGLRAEDVDGQAVDGAPDIDPGKAAARRLVLVTLRRREKPQLLHHVVEQLRTARVQRHGRVGVVGLAAEQVHRDRAGAHRVLVPRADVVTAHQELFAPLGAVDADVLTRVLRRARPLDADVAVRQNEVVFRAQGRVIVDVGQEVRLLVVLGIDVVELVLANDAQHALSLREQAVHVHVTGVAQDVVLLVELHHRVGVIRVHHRVLQLLVVSEGPAVDPDGTQFHVGARAVDGNLLRRLLLKAERGVVDIGTRAVAVHVELHQTVLRGRAHRQRHLHHVTVGVVGGELHVTRYQLVVLVGIGHRLARAETRLLCGDKEPLAAADAAHHRSRAVGNIADLQRQLYRKTGRFHVGGEGLVADHGLRAVRQLQRLAGPAAAAPVHILERGLHAAGLPDTGIALPVAAPGSVQLQQQAVGGLGNVHTAFGHVHRQAVGRRTQLQLQGLHAFFREAVGVGLHATRHADRA